MPIVPNAWVVPLEPSAFADAAWEVVSDRAARELRVAEALATAVQFRWESIAGSFLDLYEDFARGRQGEPHHLPADFFSTAPAGKSTVARITASILQRVLATR